MGKLVRRPVKVICDPQARPSLIYWQEAIYQVQITDSWKDTGSWWQGESEKHFYRLTTPCRQLWEVYYDTGDDSWWMYKIYD